MDWVPWKTPPISYLKVRSVVIRSALSGFPYESEPKREEDWLCILLIYVSSVVNCFQ